jgi:hypothetical protein
MEKCLSQTALSNTAVICDFSYNSVSWIITTALSIAINGGLTHDDDGDLDFVVTRQLIRVTLAF